MSNLKVHMNCINWKLMWVCQTQWRFIELTFQALALCFVCFCLLVFVCLFLFFIFFALMKGQCSKRQLNKYSWCSTYPVNCNTYNTHWVQPWQVFKIQSIYFNTVSGQFRFFKNTTTTATTTCTTVVSKLTAEAGKSSLWSACYQLVSGYLEGFW